MFGKKKKEENLNKELDEENKDLNLEEDSMNSDNDFEENFENKENKTKKGFFSKVFSSFSKNKQEDSEENEDLSDISKEDSVNKDNFEEELFDKEESQKKDFTNVDTDIVEDDENFYNDDDDLTEESKKISDESEKVSEDSDKIYSSTEKDYSEDSSEILEEKDRLSELDKAIEEDSEIINESAKKDTLIGDKSSEDLLEDEEDKETEEEEEEEEQGKKGFFSKVFSSFSSKVTDENFDDLFFDIEIDLLERNIGVEVVEHIKDRIKKNLENSSKSNFKKVIENELKSLLSEIIKDSFDVIDRAEKKPFKVLFVGVNGVGKTTNLIKFAHMLKKKDLTSVIAASDTFRAAAIDQLENLANKADIKLIKHDYGSDPASVAFDAVKHAEKNNLDFVLIDSAGRLHNNKNLMRELEKIYRVNEIDFVFFVGDAVAGNDLIDQAFEFSKHVPINGIILTKADTDKMLGSVISASYALKVPILYLGVGQNLDDLEQFDKEDFIESLFLN